jgi:hypothetical protein
LSGTVNGDAEIAAGKVTVSAEADVKGTLKIDSGEEPVIEPGARYGELVKVDSSAESGTWAGLAGLGLSLFFVLFAAAALLGNIVMAVVLAALMRKQVAGSVALLTDRPGAVAGVGAVTVVLAPVAFLILLMLVVTGPIAGAILAAGLFLIFFSIPFAGAVLGARVFGKMNRVGAAALMTLIITVLSLVPFFGWLVVTLAAALACGLALVGMRKGAKESKAASAAGEAGGNGTNVAGGPGAGAAGGPGGAAGAAGGPSAGGNDTDATGATSESGTTE